MRTTILKCAINNEVLCIAWKWPLPKCCDSNMHMKLFACTIFVKYNSKLFCPEWRKHCTFYCSYPFKSSNCNKQYKLSFFKVTKMHNILNLLPEKQRPLQSFSIQGQGCVWLKRVTALKCHRFDMSLQSLQKQTHLARLN